MSMPTEVFWFLPLPPTPGAYKELYPFGPASTDFHSDLGIEIDPLAVAKSPALAVTNGIVRWITDSATPGIGTLILIPGMTETSQLTGALELPDARGPGQRPPLVVFLYRHLSIASSGPFFENILVANVPPPKQDLASETPVLKFFRGKLNVWVAAGDRLALVSASSTEPGRTVMGFEIVYVHPFTMGPVGSPSFARLLRHIDPSSTARRLDPVSFYESVKAGACKATLTPSHLDHSLSTTTSRRVLLEVRDEYDEPLELSIEVNDSGQQTSHQCTKANHGTVELAVAPAAAAVSGHFRVSCPSYVLTSLPSGKIATDTIERTLATPAHWAMQAVFMADIDLPQNWFGANTVAPQPHLLPRFTAGNKVTPLRDGVEIFGAIAEAIRTVSSIGHHLYLAGWILMDEFQLDQFWMDLKPTEKPTLFKLLQNFEAARAIIRMVLWDQSENAEAAKRINGIIGAEVLLDDDTNTISGTHHQKAIVVYGDQGRIAFCGGADFNHNRMDSSNHGAVGPYHDVHARVVGPAAKDIERSFVSRWNNHPTINVHGNRLDPDAKIVDETTGSVYVQVARTYAKGPQYPFAPNGSFIPLNGLLSAIRKAKKFIYIEDQYLTPYAGVEAATKKSGSLTDDSLGVLEALRDALTRPNPVEYIVLVMPNHTFESWLATLLQKIPPIARPPIQAEALNQARYRRRNFIGGLKAVAPEKVYPFYLRRRPPSAIPQPGEEATEGDCDKCSGGVKYRDEIYCHSKVWIVDDIMVKIGSANCNRRSYTNDGEMDLIMLDGSVDSGARSLAQRLRVDLWSEHLGLEWPESALLEDYRAARQFWDGSLRPNSHLGVYDYDSLETETGHTNWDWVDPDGSS
jgi:phosphatidylserine/phosphatidylglycerophosphate/cardiolipin synthase-like enzyme